MKVDFDTENWEIGVGTHGDSYGGPSGIQTLDNGLTFLGCASGGDWEGPVFFIVGIIRKLRFGHLVSIFHCQSSLPEVESKIFVGL